MAKEKVNKEESKAKEAILNKLDALKKLQGELNKEYGQGSVFIGSDGGDLNVKSIPTGSLQLDNAIGIGGVPRGRIVEIYGLESSGKTTLALSIIAQAQKNGGVVAFVDAEHALDRSYAAKLGVDLDAALISQPDSGEQALNITDKIVESGAVDVIVVDSVAALTPEKELEGEIGDNSVGTQARMMSQALRILKAKINKSNCVVIFINQIRMKIGVMFGNPETTSGGNALKFYASLRLEVRKGEAIKEGEGDAAQQVGHFMNVKLVKNKVGRPATKLELPLIYGLGIDHAAEIYKMAGEMGIVEVSGRSHVFEGEKVANSKAEMSTLLRSDSPIAKRVESKVMEALSAQKAAEEAALKAKRGEKAS